MGASSYLKMPNLGWRHDPVWGPHFTRKSLQGLEAGPVRGGRLGVTLVGPSDLLPRAGHSANITQSVRLE
jgi:hypothetical protein